MTSTLKGKDYEELGFGWRRIRRANYIVPLTPAHGNMYARDAIAYHGEPLTCRLSDLVEAAEGCDSFVDAVDVMRRITEEDNEALDRMARWEKYGIRYPLVDD